MAGEFENQIKKKTDNKSAEKIVEVINAAGQNFLVYPALLMMNVALSHGLQSGLENQSPNHSIK